MTVDISVEPVDPSRCPLCGAVVACGVVALGSGKTGSGGGIGSEVQCWCLDWPRLPASARLGVGACLCPACLRAALVAAGVPVDGTAAVPDTPG
ncbi:cysteine-rich CWC family protein [Pandoraea oxalativorans]|uniref:Uncharacterized protein n=1 Tax=Pandoraea oxalativorans TaxID=573737 RepID=A0A0E3YGL2_9BURK|nr:cysteine-rich CWC family protein [Pandoraea oxalativorans]AKC72157.2 hypothetical protein MB84_05655 [Pandoraea oxalativorans]